MKPAPNDKSILYRHFLNGECTREQLEELFSYFGTADEASLRLLIRQELQAAETDGGEPADRDEVLKLVYRDIDARISGPKRGRIFTMPRRIAAAAAVLAVVATGLYFYRSRPAISDSVAPVAVQQYIGPGGDKAVLSLSDGRRLVLSDIGDGVIATEGSTVISKSPDGQLVYSEGGETGAVQWNTLSTPRGGQYRLALPDGSHVWLNAASSLKYPAVFTGTERRVELTGEAYFEIAPDRAHPFIVQAADQAVKVLGTHFNIKAYADEPVQRTTLLEGAVEVSSGQRSVRLVPGEQAQLSSGRLKTTTVDTENAVAWKNGKIIFRRAAISEALREISRWYDIEVTYSGRVPDYTISGEVSRQADLSAILDILKRIDVNYRQEGRKLIIQP